MSTGDSLDMTPHDETSIVNNNAAVKDMELCTSLIQRIYRHYIFVSFLSEIGSHVLLAN
jgi:hypothetical protein